MSKPKLKVTGGNTLAMLGAAINKMEQEGYSNAEISKLKADALSGDYNQAIRAISKYFDIV